MQYVRKHQIHVLDKNFGNVIMCSLCCDIDVKVVIVTVMLHLLILSTHPNAPRLIGFMTLKSSMLGGCFYERKLYKIPEVIKDNLIILYYNHRIQDGAVL